MTTYVKITDKILGHFPDWNSIVNKIGVILEKKGNSALVRICSDGKYNLGIEYTLPLDSLRIIPYKEAVEEAIAPLKP